MGKVSCLPFHIDGTSKLQVAVEVVRGSGAPEQGLVEQISPTLCQVVGRTSVHSRDLGKSFCET